MRSGRSVFGVGGGVFWEGDEAPVGRGSLDAVA